VLVVCLTVLPTTQTYRLSLHALFRSSADLAWLFHALWGRRARGHAAGTPHRPRPARDRADHRRAVSSAHPERRCRAEQLGDSYRLGYSEGMGPKLTAEAILGVLLGLNLAACEQKPEAKPEAEF